MGQIARGCASTMLLSLAVLGAGAPVAAATRIRPGYIVGTARTECGQPISAFRVAAYGFDGNVNVNPGGLPFLGDTVGHGGRYALRTRDSIHQRRPVNALVRGVEAATVDHFGGQRYVLALDPTDHKRDGTGSSDFKGYSGRGIVRDFVLRTSGLRPGAGAYRGRETETDDSADGEFYGGNMIISLGFYPQPGQTLTATLTPTSRLVDGCPSHTVVRTADVGRQSSSSVYLHSVPLADYVLTVSINGTPLGLHRNGDTGNASSLPISFPPTPELPDGGSAFTIDAGYAS